MKKLLFFLLISTVFLTKGFSQVANMLSTANANPVDSSVKNFVFVDKRPGQLNRMYLAKVDSLRLFPWNVRWLNDTIISIGDGRYAQLLGAYSNPNFINSLSAAKVFGLSPVAISGNYNDLSNLPNLNLKYDASNPNGFISGITGPMITAALGYVPYNGSTNPNGYITQDNVYNAGAGIMKFGTEPSATFVADTSMLMTVSRATDSIGALVGMITNKQSYSDTNTYDATRFWVNSRGFLTSFTEVDPTVPSYVKSISTGDITNWNGKLNTTDTANKWYPRNSNPSNYLTTITSGQISSALGYSPLSPNDTLSLSNRINLKLNISDTTGKWKNSNYSPSSVEIISGLGYTPTTQVRTITINGSTQDLSANRTWSVGTLVASDTVSLSTRINTKFNIPSGTTGQYLNGLGNPITFPTIPTNTNQLTNGSGFITNAGARSAISLTTTGNSGASTYNSTTGVLNIPNYATPSAPTFNPSPGRSLNTNYTVSATQNARVSYTVALTTTLSLLNLNSAARVFLEYSTNGGSSWNTINSAGTSRTLSVAITIGINETTYWNLVGEIPTNALVRLRSTTSGGGTAAFDSGIEVVY